MQSKEWTKSWQNSQLDMRLLQAYYVHHAYPRHSHDYYVLCVIERGRQSFTHEGKKYLTPAGGLILINPGAVHTGEAADEAGFQMRCVYPTVEHMRGTVAELTGRDEEMPYFTSVRVDQPEARRSVVALHKALTEGAGATGAATAMEAESRFTMTMAELVRSFGNLEVREQRTGKETVAIQRARDFMDERYAEGIGLTELAAHVALSPFYFLRAFRAQVGMPPHAYLESVRIRHAQGLIEAGTPLSDVAAEVGFSSQSHLTHRFKQIIGVTPGQYAQRI